MTMTQTAIAILAILFIGTSTLITNRQHYDLMYHQGYDQIAQRMQQDNDSITDIRFATATLNARFPEFYQAQTEVHRRAIFGEYDNTPADFRHWLENDESEYLGFGWTDFVNPYWEAQAVAYYPWQVHVDHWFTSRYLTLSKDSVPNAEKLLHPLIDIPYSLNRTEWGKPLYIYGDSLDDQTAIVGVVATIQAIDTVPGFVVVMEVLDAATDSLLLWHGNEISDTLMPGTHRLVDALRFDEMDFPVKGKVIKTFLWNKQRGMIVAQRTDYYTTYHNPRLIGLQKPL